jgi:two-component system, NtrC family, sensor kinase
MKRRSRAGGKAGKTGRRKAATPKPRRNPSKAVPGHRSATAGQETEIARLTRERDDALEREKATAEVLDVVSAPSVELEPVFQTILQNATRICGARFGALFLRDGDGLRGVAFHNAPPAFAQAMSSIFHAPRFTAIARAASTKQAAQIVDIAATPGYAEANPFVLTATELGGFRTVLSVPMLRDGDLTGIISIFRRQVEQFTDEQIELVSHFAKQAVIAIENARLLSELREALEQQTATSEVLGVISSAMGELDPVFEAMVKSAARLLDVPDAEILLRDDNALRSVARHGASAQWPLGTTRIISRDWVTGRSVSDRVVVHVADLQAEEDEYPEGATYARQYGHRTTLAVPLLQKASVIGAFLVRRMAIKPFTEKQIELVQNFAAQAVIAIENTRLLNELRQRTGDLTESLEQQTATSEILRVISSSLGELEPVFQAMLANATRICHAKFGILMLHEGGGFRSVAIEGAPEAYAAAMAQNPLIPPRAGSGLVALTQTKQPVQLADLQAEPGYVGNRLTALAGARTLLMVPLLRDDEIVGALNFYRQEVRPFTDKQVALVESFAAQAVIAIENARLLNELRQRTSDLSKSLEDLRSAQDRLVQTQKLASLGQLTAGIAHEIKNPLNFVNNFSGVSVELIDELQETLGRVTADKKTREEIVELADTLRDNLDKIVQHGKRADSIVKNMLLHSREGSGERRPVDVNALVEESLNLAYHGARAEKRDFSIAVERSFDPAAGEVEAFPQEISRVLLNLIANGFYAATKRRGQDGGNGFEPTITAATRSLGDRVEIRIRDNGTGIPPEVREKMFNPFFTTKPAGEGTGLGLSISHDIIVKQHSGVIEVATEPGEFTEFRIILPRTVA